MSDFASAAFPLFPIAPLEDNLLARTDFLCVYDAWKLNTVRLTTCFDPCIQLIHFGEKSGMIHRDQNILHLAVIFAIAAGALDVPKGMEIH